MRHLQYTSACALALLGLAISPACFSQEVDSAAASDVIAAQPATSDDLAAIRAGSPAFAEAFNKQDAKAVAALWTANGEYVDDSGVRYSGRQEIEDCYAQFFTENPKSRIRIVVDSLRLLSENAAIEEGRSMIHPAPSGAPGFGKYTAVHVKVDGKWLMGTVTDRWTSATSGYERVSDLGWLVGTWSAKEHGAETKSECRWVANKSFVQRNYTVTGVDGTKTSGVQIIGWNSQAGHVQSWNFSADGGHAIGIWVPTEGGWIAEIQGATGDGVPTSAVNTLVRLDDNAYVWQSVDRSLGDAALPDTGEIVIRRTAAD